VETIRPAEKQGRNLAEHEKGKPQNFPVFAYSDIYFPVFLQFLVDLTLYEYKNAINFGASRQLWSDSIILPNVRSEKQGRN